MSTLLDATPNPAHSADLLSRVVSAPDLAAAFSAAPPWLWQGYLAPGKVTLLTSQWKSGKTTLVSVLLARLQAGGQLAGLPVTPGKALVVSEESASDWDRRGRQLALGPNVSFLCRPFPGKPTMAQWLALVDALAQLRRRDATDLVVIDPLAAFLPGHAENQASAILECLLPFQRLASAGLAVLLSHHPPKGATLPGQAARGSGALSGFADILIEMSWVTHPGDSDRRRRLRAYSRHEQTPRHLVIEWTADGTDYVVCPDTPEADLPGDWQAAQFVLEEATQKLTRDEILERWPPDFAKPDRATLWRCVARAVAQRTVSQQGTGRANDPFRYWLPERTELMRPDLGASAEEMRAWNDRVVKEMLDSFPK